MDAGCCIQLSEGQCVPGLPLRQPARQQRQRHPLLGQTAFLVLQESAHDEGSLGRSPQVARRRTCDLLIRGPGVFKVGLIAGFQIQLPHPLFEVRRPERDLRGRPIDLRHGLPIDAFVSVMVAIAVVSKFIDVLDNANGRADVGRCVKTENGFRETAVTDGLIIGQQRLYQRL